MIPSDERAQARAQGGFLGTCVGHPVRVNAAATTEIKPSGVSAEQRLEGIAIGELGVAQAWSDQGLDSIVEFK